MSHHYFLLTSHRIPRDNKLGSLKTWAHTTSNSHFNPGYICNLFFKSSISLVTNPFHTVSLHHSSIFFQPIPCILTHVLKFQPISYIKYNPSSRSYTTHNTAQYYVPILALFIPSNHFHFSNEFLSNDKWIFVDVCNGFPNLGVNLSRLGRSQCFCLIRVLSDFRDSDEEILSFVFPVDN